MPKKLFRPSKKFVEEWPEAFEDLYINTMPVAYVEYIHIEFDDGSIWEIDIKEQMQDLQNPDKIAAKVLETIEEYRHDIGKIGFKLDIKKLKQDINESSSNILKIKGIDS